MQGDLNGALEQFMEAKRVYIATGTLETPDGASCYEHWSGQRQAG